MATTSQRTAAAGLCFTTAVDRTLIHRHRASESFLADVVATGPDTFDAAALLPAVHPHYGGHIGPSRTLDPLLLLECARQAETYAAHVLHGVPAGDRFVLRTWSARFATDPPAADTPTELLLTVRTRDARRLGDRLQGLVYEFDLWTRQERAGRVRMAVRYVPPAVYAALRGRHRTGVPPTSDTVPITPGRPVEPARVGRLRATDAVLLDVAQAPRSCTARLRVPAENPSLFDHVQDHLPAMVLTESARQIAVLATHAWTGAAPTRTRLAALEATFDRYAELDAPVEISATPGDPSGPGQAVHVTFRQAGADVAAMRVQVAAAAGRSAP